MEGYIFPKGDPKKLSQSSLSVVGHVRSEDLSTSFLETFSTIIIDEFDDSELSLVQQQSKMTSRAFFEQFINLKTSNEVDLSYLEILLKNGANVNFMDTYGHTVLHEVARNWKVDVAEFLVEQGAAVNHCDMFGRTALHVAAAANNVEMIEFLIQNKAKIEQVSDGDLLTPMHYAAKHDALEAVICLYDHHANIHRRDFKKRTPLYLAAENGYSRTAMMLLKMGACATVEDASGYSCLTEMIIKIPTVAKYALDQLHIIDETGKKQQYYLKYLTPTSDMENKTVSYKTLLEVVLMNKSYDVVEHPVLKKLIDLKWRKYGLKSNQLLIMIDLIFIFSWVFIMLTKKWEIGYILPKDWWLVSLSVFCLGEMLYVIYAEIHEFLTLSIEMRKWKKWRKSQVLKDQVYCHPRWPQSAIGSSGATVLWMLFAWHVHDCIIMSFLLVVVCTHFVALSLTVNIDILHRHLIAMSLIPLWLKNLKHLRAFSIIGPFIVTIARIMVDVAKFLFLYFEIFIAFTYSYWLIFGGTQELETFDTSLYFVFRISVRDEWQRAYLEDRDLVLTYIIIGTHVGFTSFLCFSIFVAMINNAYMSVHENLNANVLMQRVSIILRVEKNWFTCLHWGKLQSFIQEHCAPLEVRYNRMRNQRTLNTFPLGETKAEEEKELLESVLRVKEILSDCTNIITGIPKKKEAESWTNVLQTSRESKSKKLATLQKDLWRVQQELEVLQSQQDIIDEELQKDMEKLQKTVQEMCELHHSRGLTDRVPKKKNYHSIQTREEFLRKKLQKGNLYLGSQDIESKKIINQHPQTVANPDFTEKHTKV